MAASPAAPASPASSSRLGSGLSQIARHSTVSPPTTADRIFEPFLTAKPEGMGTWRSVPSSGSGRCGFQRWFEWVSASPRGSADDRTEIAAVEMRLLVGDDIGLDVAEGRIRLVLDAVVEGLDDVFFEVLSAGMRLHDRLAFDVAEFGIAQPQDVHLDTCGNERDDRMQVLRNPGRSVEGDRRPAGVDIAFADAVSRHKRARR